MDGTLETELSRGELLALLKKRDAEIALLKQQLAALQQQIDMLRLELDSLKGGKPTPRLDESYSLDAEEKRQAKKSNKKHKQKSPRRGRRKTQDKLDQAERTQIVLPEGCAFDECRLVQQRPAWRIENGRAVLVAYDIYRGPHGEPAADIPGLLPNTEFGLEIYVATGWLVNILGLSMDKVLSLFQFFWQLELSKSQADRLLNRLSREWEREFDALCQLLAVSTVVHADETSWSINSVWAFLSERVRVLVFGCHKDNQTLEAMLPKDVFDGVLVSDDAAVYRNFSKAQKCWAHLIRKAIKLTLLDPENNAYRRFLDGLLELYRTACRHAADGRLGEAGRDQKVCELNDLLCGLIVDRLTDESEPTTEAERDFRNLVRELHRLMDADELFTFVRHPEATGTNNEAERSLRNPAMDRRTGRTSKTLKGARRRTILVSVLESLRLHLPKFTLQAVLEEVAAWGVDQAGRFQKMLEELGLGPPIPSPLDSILGLAAE